MDNFFLNFGRVFTEADDNPVGNFGNRINNAADRIDSSNKRLDKHRVDTRSIVAKARNSIMQFPVYITNTIPVNEATIISKYLERIYVTFVQLSISQHQIISEEEANNLGFMKHFHTNIHESVQSLLNEYYEPIDENDRMMTESIHCVKEINEYCSVEFNICPYNQYIAEECNNLMHEPLEGFSYLRETSRNTTDNSETIVFSDGEKPEDWVNTNEKDVIDQGLKEKEFDQDDYDLSKQSDADVKNDLIVELKQKDPNITDPENQDPHFGIKLKSRQNKRDNAKKLIDNYKEKYIGYLKNNKIDGYQYRNGFVYKARHSQYAKRTTRPGKPDYIQNGPNVPVLLKENDIKKVNAGAPFTFTATFRVNSSGNNPDKDLSFVLGVKTVLHIIRPQDLSEELRELVTGKVKSLQKVRYKTGEIKFMDYMFNFKELKTDASKRLTGNKRWISTLKRLAELDKTSGSIYKMPLELIHSKGIPIPNGTLILTEADVNMLKDQTGIDLSKKSNVIKLSKNLFLLTFIIVDAAASSMKMLYPDDPDPDWDIQSLETVDAEASKTQNSKLASELNKIINR